MRDLRTSRWDRLCGERYFGHDPRGLCGRTGFGGPDNEEDYSLNNNRNNNNRRRGRGNRNQGGANSANRIDSRARGNAPQLPDKYKKLAQDAQHHGDRVQAEYYLQFADHYFRVIADNKARQDEQRAKRDAERGTNQDDDDSDDDGNDRRQRRNPRARRDQDDGDQQDGRQQDGREQGRSRRSRDDRQDDMGDDNPFVKKRGKRANGRDDEQTEEKPRRTRKPRKTDQGELGAEGEIDAAVLPPSIAAEDGGAKPAAKPRRRKSSGDDSEDDGGKLSAVG